MVSKRALIVGISGQDGAYLSSLLIQKGYLVFGTSRDADGSTFRNLKLLGIKEKVTLLSMVTNDFRSVLQVVSKVQPDEIYNLAGQSSVALSFDQPVEALESILISTVNLLEVIRYFNPAIRFYSACSSECFGDTDGAAANESTPFRPLSPYAVAKSASFWQVANYRSAYGLYACSGILFNHESPLRPDRFVTRKIVSSAVRIAKGSAEILKLGNISVSRDWGWAPEFVDAMWRMLQAPIADDYVVATGETISLEDFVEIVFSHLGLNWRDHVEVSESLIRPSDIAISRADPSKAFEQLGWRAEIKSDQVIAKLIAWEMGR